MIIWILILENYIKLIHSLHSEGFNLKIKRHISKAIYKHMDQAMIASIKVFYKSTEKGHLKK